MNVIEHDCFYAFSTDMIGNQSINNKKIVRSDEYDYSSVNRLILLAVTGYLILVLQISRRKVLRIGQISKSLDTHSRKCFRLCSGLLKQSV